VTSLATITETPNNKFNLILDIFFFTWTDVTQTANTALQRYSDFNNPSNCSLTKVQNNLAKELLRTITVTVPLVLPDYQPMLLSQRNSKTHSFLNKLRYSPETELINNFDKGHNSVLIAKIQHFVSITNINNDVMALWAHRAEVLSNLEHFSINTTKRERNCLWA
jgi:hypothetical protein